MAVNYLKPHPSGTLLLLKIHPSARKNAIVGVHDGRLKVSLTAPPVDGKANRALIVFLAKELGAAKSALTLTAGETSRQKTVLASGLSPEQVQERLAKWF